MKEILQDIAIGMGLSVVSFIFLFGIFGTKPLTMQVVLGMLACVATLGSFMACLFALMSKD